MLDEDEDLRMRLEADVRKYLGLPPDDQQPLPVQDAQPQVQAQPAPAKEAPAQEPDPDYVPGAEEF